MAHETQPYIFAENEGKAVWFLGTLQTFKATGDVTANAFTLVECLMPPGFTPGPHIHHEEDEAFYILDGEITVTAGGQTWTARPRSFVFLPRGIEHVFVVGESAPARILQITHPSGFEHFSAEMGEPAQAPVIPPPQQPDLQKLAQLAEKYKIEMRIPAATHDEVD